MSTGLLLLTGGLGSRMGSPKHTLPHPEGGTWGAHLIQVFTEVCPGGPVWVLGAPLPDRPGLPRTDDPRQGPAVALRLWCSMPVPAVARWWVAACDQVRWTPDRWRAWLERASAADPGATQWILARHQGHAQPLGSLLAASLRTDLAMARGGSLMELLSQVPHQMLEVRGSEWLDVDTPEARRIYEQEG